MNELPKSQDKLLDERLSDFTDLLLSGGDDMITQEAAKDDGLIELKQTAMRMKVAAQMARPSSTVSARVRTRLLKEWKLQSQQPKRFGLLKSLFSPMPSPRYAMAGGLVILLLLSIVTFFAPGTTSLTGAAVGFHAWTPFLILLGIILVIVLAWFDRRQ